MAIKQIRGKTMNFKHSAFSFLGLLAFLLTAQLVLAAEESNDGWQYHGSLYLWAADIDIQDPDGENDTISFNDIVKNLEMVLMGGLGGRKDKLGFQIDAIYLDVSDQDESTVIPGLLTLTEVELTTTILTPMATYRVVEDGQLSLDLLGGARYLHMDLTLKFDEISSTNDDANIFDGIVGFRGDIKLNKDWHLPFYYDIGKGDTELTYQAFAGINYKYSSFDLAAGYRYLKFKFDDDEDFGNVLNHLIIKGPLIGVKYWF